ncbi:hypothetical protein MHB48_15180 [Psychrobacillus sp. FSL H8-0483]|uniref:hypothetical protein n=1 Tax=Psychrobacillus sp. FSL H8-0483 TaxID=2921389 RepID=UPI00315A90EF
MELNQALKELTYKKQLYFKWKNDYGMRNPRTEESILKEINAKDFFTYEKWELSEEYQFLMNLLLQSKIGQDMQIIYEATSEKAKSGDEKATKLLFEIQKQIVAMNKEYKSKKPTKKSSENVYDDLEL